MTLAAYIAVTVATVAAFFLLCFLLLLAWAAGETYADRRRRRVEARSRERWVG